MQKESRNAESSIEKASVPKNPKQSEDISRRDKEAKSHSVSDAIGLGRPNQIAGRVSEDF